MDNVPEILRNTAKNMNVLLMQLADLVEKLEAENAELKAGNNDNEAR